MRELDLYMEAEDWEVMYMILYRAVSEAVDRMRPLPGNSEVCEVLAGAMERAGVYQRVVRDAVFGESERAQLQKRQEVLRILRMDAENTLTEL